MLKIFELDGNGNNAKGQNVLDYMLQRELKYYSNGVEIESSSQWFGKGAAALGLSGECQLETMVQLGKGFAPDGTALVQNAGEPSRPTPVLDALGQPVLDEQGKPRTKQTHGHRVGRDINYSTDKSISVLYMLSEKNEDRDAILGCHVDAVKSVLSYIEQETMETRRGHGSKDVIQTSGIVVSMNLHLSNRNLEPNLHVHAIQFQPVLGTDGKWGATANENLITDQRALGALARAQEAYNLRTRLGVGISRFAEKDLEGRETGNHFVRVAGISEELRDHYSSRHKEIEDFVAEHGGTTRDAALKTRARKEEPDLAETRKHWAESLAELRREKPDLVPKFADLVGRKPEIEPTFDRKESDERILRVLHDKTALFTKSQLIEKIAMEHIGRLDIAGVLQETKEFIERNDLVRLRPQAIHAQDRGQHLARRHREERFAAGFVVAQEQEIMERALARKDDDAVRLDRTTVDRRLAEVESRLSAEAGKSVTFSPRQRMVSEHVLTSGSVAVIGGRAGTGKTFTSKGWIGVLKLAGRDVIGCSTGWAAAKKLEAESGIESFSTASLLSQLDKGKIALSPRSVVVLDEGGMAGTTDMLRLLRHVDRAGGKLVVQGDVMQLSPVAAGNPFKLLVRANGEAVLSQILRQRHQADRDTAGEFYKRDPNKLHSRAENRQHGLDVLQRMDQRDQISRHEDRVKAKASMIDVYLSSPLPAFQKLMMAGTRDEVRSVNLAVRQRLRAKKCLGAEEVVVQAQDYRNRFEVTLSVGDRIRFTKKQKELGVFNGEEAEVVRRTEHGFLVRLDSEVKSQHGRLVEIDLRRGRQHLDLGYCSTVHKAQGQGKELALQLFEPSMVDHQSALVGFTRTIGSYRLFGAAADMDARLAGEKIGTSRAKENALDLMLVKQSPPAPIQAAPSATERKLAAHQRLLDGARRATEHKIESVKTALKSVREKLRRGPKLAR